VSRSKKPSRKPIHRLPETGRLLGLDLSLTGTGLAVLDLRTRKILHADTLNTKSKRGADRLTTIRDSVIGVARKYDVTDTIAEYFGMSAKRGAGGIQTVWLHGIVVLALVEAGYPSPLYVAPASLKKLSTGDGFADKDAMREALRKLLRVDYENDNTVDACLITYWLSVWHAWRRNEYDASAYEEGVFLKLERAIPA
jgi:Holliday junction resolvasome RuvABC endonuclease subunit